MSEVFSRKLVHCDAQLNIDIMPDVETMPGSRSLIGRERHLVNFSLSALLRNKSQTFYHTACKSKFHSSNRNQLQYKVAEIGIHWKNQTETLDNRCLKMRLVTTFFEGITLIIAVNFFIDRIIFRQKISKLIVIVYSSVIKIRWSWAKWNSKWRNDQT